MHRDAEELLDDSNDSRAPALEAIRNTVGTLISGGDGQGEQANEDYDG